MTETFGFKPGPQTTADKLKRIQPGADRQLPDELAKVDAAGEALGFRSREGVDRAMPARRRRDIGPTLALNMRAPERVAIPFIKFCEDQRFSYWEGLEELMKRASLADGKS